MIIIETENLENSIEHKIWYWNFNENKDWTLRVTKNPFERRE